MRESQPACPAGWLAGWLYDAAAADADANWTVYKSLVEGGKG